MNYYSENAKEYIDSTINADMSELYAMFEPLLPKGGRILDVGFGSARDMLYFQSKGYDVAGIDIEPKFVEHAEKLGLKAEVADVLSYESVIKYDGIWACASLLHVDYEKLNEALKRLLGLLKDGGILFVSMKEGDFKGTDDKGRPLVMVREDFFSHYDVVVSRKTIESRRNVSWINVIIRK